MRSVALSPAYREAALETMGSTELDVLVVGGGVVGGGGGRPAPPPPRAGSWAAELPSTPSPAG
jgi:hypothetical protein